MDFVSGAAVALVGAATGAFFHRWITKADRDRHEKWEFQRDAAEILGHAWRALDECNPDAFVDVPKSITTLQKRLTRISGDIQVLRPKLRVLAIRWKGVEESIARLDAALGTITQALSRLIRDQTNTTLRQRADELYTAADEALENLMTRLGTLP